jgi:hypothetical protein
MGLLFYSLFSSSASINYDILGSVVEAAMQSELGGEMVFSFRYLMVIPIRN